MAYPIDALPAADETLGRESPWGVGMRIGRIGKATTVLLLVAAACSSKSTPETKGSTSPTPTPSACIGKQVPITFPCPLYEAGSPQDLTTQGDNVRFTLVGGDGVWDNTFFKVKPGAKVTVTLQSGDFLHNFNIDSPSVKRDMAPSSKQDVSFTLPTAGPVIFYCNIHPPMKGAFYFT